MDGAIICGVIIAIDVIPVYHLGVQGSRYNVHHQDEFIPIHLNVARTS